MQKDAELLVEEGTELWPGHRLKLFQEMVIDNLFSQSSCTDCKFNNSSNYW